MAIDYGRDPGDNYKNPKTVSMDQGYTKGEQEGKQINSVASVIFTARKQGFTFDDYQALSADTAIYPGKGNINGLMYVGLGLGEAGEVQGKIKKIWRDDLFGQPIENPQKYSPQKVEAIKSELGDLLWYVAQTATELGLSLGDIAISNIDKLQDRKERGVLQGSGDNR